MKDIFVPLACLWVLLFFVALPLVKSEPELPKASAFNQAIKERNQGDERATYADKQTVKNILATGCLPVIPKNTNLNIQSSCDPS
jgi:hypothetical protein